MSKRGWVAGLGLVLCWAAQGADGDLARLDAARDLWHAAQHGDYRYAYQKICECRADDPYLTFVTVTDGQVARVYHLHSDSPREVPAREGSLDLYWTIDDLFDKLADAYERGLEVRVQYDERLGFPTSLHIDYDPGLIGDETDLKLSEVEIL